MQRWSRRRQPCWEQGASLWQHPWTAWCCHRPRTWVARGRCNSSGMSARWSNTMANARGNLQHGGGAPQPTHPWVRTERILHRIVCYMFFMALPLCSLQAQPKHIAYWDLGASLVDVLQLFKRWQVSTDHWCFSPLQLSKKSLGQVSLAVPQASLCEGSKPIRALDHCGSALADYLGDLQSGCFSCGRCKSFELHLLRYEPFQPSENMCVARLHDTGHACRHIQQAQTCCGTSPGHQWSTMARACIHAQDKEMAPLEVPQAFTQQLHNPAHHMLIYPGALLAQDKNTVCPILVQNVGHTLRQRLLVANGQLRKGALNCYIVTHEADECQCRSSGFQTRFLLSLQSFFLGHVQPNGDSTCWQGGAQSDAGLVQIDVYHLLFRAGLCLQEVVPLPSGFGLWHRFRSTPKFWYVSKHGSIFGPIFRRPGKSKVAQRARFGAHFLGITFVSDSWPGVPEFAAPGLNIRTFALRTSNGNWSPCLNRPCTTLQRRALRPCSSISGNGLFRQV